MEQVMNWVVYRQEGSIDRIRTTLIRIIEGSSEIFQGSIINFLFEEFERNWTSYDIQSLIFSKLEFRK
ncbi:hypothetical protein [Candidatus Coxiella mudrowiae]|uniref:hypothetical protein n=1 Tax=Candidatus Coxiella mudrowiae TaxID=2054173 RepID=UPI000C28E24C|nr:hypothetical protein [Candidatus Coxiella mudrowiae]